MPVRASGELNSLAEFIRKSGDLGRFESKEPEAWQEGIARFEKANGCVSN